MKCVASRKRSIQISPDDFDVWNETLICHADTTVGEIRAWATRNREATGPMHVMLDDAEEAKETP